MRLASLPLAGVAAILCSVTSTSAHVSISSGPATAGGRAIVTFSVGHGCEGADTTLVNVDIPSEVTSVRGMPGFFGSADVQLDDSGAPSHVVWTKDEIRDVDDQYYELSMRINVPDAPFSVLYFPVLQGCRDADGMEYATDWAAMPGDESEGDSEDEPAAELVIMPARHSGWNKYVVPTDVTDLGLFFPDAEIVWSGDAAFSANPTTAAMIEEDEDVDVLSEIAEGAEIWVKY